MTRQDQITYLSVGNPTEFYVLTKSRQIIRLLLLNFHPLQSLYNYIRLARVSPILLVRMRLLQDDSNGAFCLTADLFDEDLCSCSYAVLSHRWGHVDEEVTYEDIEKGSGQDKAGYKKIEFCNQQAAKDGLKYCWIDTCCINRQSNFELSEAINSMYRWYKCASQCYVFLSDVSKEDMPDSLARSQWFERGWTLQELLAPPNVAFFDCNGHILGDRQSLRDEIARITGISSDILQTGDLTKSCIVQKMSWAARRKTTRVEDGAYCLMGLFDANMPLLYGERHGAFVRLQEEIIRESDDHSIFAWSMNDKLNVSGLIAPSTADFADCDQFRESRSFQRRSSYSLTNRGLSINLRLTPWSTATYLACLDVQQEQGFKLCIFLRRLSEDDQYARVELDGCSVFTDTQRVFDSDHRPIRAQQLYIRKIIKPAEVSLCRLEHLNAFRISEEFLCNKFIVSQHVCNSGQVVSFLSGGWGHLVTVDCSREYKGLKRFTLGFDFDFNPVCILEDSSADSQSIFPKQNDTTTWFYYFPDDFEWNVIEEGRSYRPQNHNGVWALRGHRIHGLDVMLMSNPGGTNSVLVRIVLSEHESRCIWDIFIEDLGRIFAGPKERAFRQAWGSRHNFQASHGLGNTNEELDEGDAIIHAMYYPFRKSSSN